MQQTNDRPRPSQVFEQTYRDYLSRIEALDFSSLALRLGGLEITGGLEIPFFGDPHRITRDDILDPEGERPDFSVRLILLKYILLCPREVPRTGQWSPYHAFKDSGPLTVFFPNTVEAPLAQRFSGRLEDFDQASRRLDGRTPRTPLPYDRCYRFTPLPRVPLLTALNDQDSDFPAQCTIFFRETTDQFLDCECLAILGGLLSRRLIAAVDFRRGVPSAAGGGGSA